MVATKSVNEFFTNYGWPYKLLTDRGGSSEKFLFKEICDLAKVTVTVMAPLSVYSISEPLGLTLGSQCALETVKMDLLFEELLFGTKQLKQKSRQNWSKYFTKPMFLI